MGRVKVVLEATKPTCTGLPIWPAYLELQRATCIISPGATKLKSSDGTFVARATRACGTYKLPLACEELARRVVLELQAVAELWCFR